MSLECIKAGLRWKVSWLFIGLAGAFGVFFGARCLSPIVNGPTYIIRETTLLSPSISEGQPLRLKVHAARTGTSQCTGYVIREFSRVIMFNGAPIREKFRLALAPPPIPEREETEYLLIIPTSTDMPPGHWIFRGRTTLDCGFLFGGITYYDTPEIEFDITL